MSPVVYREEESPGWGVAAMILAVVAFAMLIAILAWWVPRNVNSAPRDQDVIVTPQQPPPSQPAPSVIPVPVPGPQGPSGPAGPAGPAGPSGPAAPAQPSAPEQPASPPDGASPGGS